MLALVLAVMLVKIRALNQVFAAVSNADRRDRRSKPRRHILRVRLYRRRRLPYELKFPAKEFVLAFNALPVVLLMSVLTTLLFYWGILPPIIKGFAFALKRTMGVGGAVGLSTAANIFVGHVEAPLFIRPYLAKLSRSELFVVMTGGMAGIAGTVLVLYAQFLAT